jgi:hypothetical protein
MQLSFEMRRRRNVRLELARRLLRLGRRRIGLGRLRALRSGLEG